MITKQTASGLIFNDNKQILMVKHKAFDLWLMPGGQIEEGESPCMAVRREVLEETGLKIKILPLNNNFPDLYDGIYELPRPFCIWNFKWNDQNQLDYVYLCKIIEGDLKINETEILDIGWFYAEEIRELDSFDNVKIVIDRFLETYDKILQH